MGNLIRKTSASGTFYPNNRKELYDLVSGYINSAFIINNKNNIKALIVPHAGYIFSGITAGWGYKQIVSGKRQMASGKNNNHFVIVGPSHNCEFDGIVGNNYDYWETPIGKIKHNKPKGKIKILNEAFVSEHSIEVQLPFIQTINNSAVVSCFLTGMNLDIKKSADYFLQYYSKSVFIFSSDLSHYLSEDEARMKDRKTIGAILNGNQKYFHEQENTACGFNGIQILMEMARIQKWQPELIYYDTSASFNNDLSKVVGYATVLYL